MKTKDLVAVAYACEQIRRCVNICEKAGISGKALNLVLIGLAGIKKQYREAREK